MTPSQDSFRSVLPSHGLIPRLSDMGSLAGQLLPGHDRSPRSPGEYPRAGLSMRFQVTLEEWGADLGMWASCRGLQVQFSAQEIREGGQYCEHTLLPDRVTFNTVTLERVMTKTDSPRLQEWLARVAAQWSGYEYENGVSGLYPGQDVTIRLFDHQGHVVTHWMLHNAFPKEWVGPDLDAQSASVAIERISFEHSGFLQHDADRSGGGAR